MSIVAVEIPRNISESKHIQLRLSTTTGGIDRKQNGPGDQAANKANGGSDLEVSKQQIGVQRVMAQNIGVWQFGHRGDPANESWFRCRSALLVAQGADVCSREILSALTPAQDDEEQDHGAGDDEGRHQRRDEAGGGVGSAPCLFRVLNRVSMRVARWQAEREDRTSRLTKTLRGSMVDGSTRVPQQRKQGVG